MHIHSAECTVRLLNQAGGNNYPYNPKYVETPGIDPVTSGLTSVGISNQQLYQLSYSTTLPGKSCTNHILVD